MHFTSLPLGKEQQREKERPGKRQSQSPGGEGLRDWEQGQWGKEGDQPQRKFLLGNATSGNDEQGLGCGRGETHCKTGNGSLGTVSSPGAQPSPHCTPPKVKHSASSEQAMA